MKSKRKKSNTKRKKSNTKTKKISIGGSIMKFLNDDDKKSPSNQYINKITHKKLICSECNHEQWDVKTVAIGGRLGEFTDLNFMTDKSYVFHICKSCTNVKIFREFLIPFEHKPQSNP